MWIVKKKKVSIKLQKIRVTRQSRDIPPVPCVFAHFLFFWWEQIGCPDRKSVTTTPPRKETVRVVTQQRGDALVRIKKNVSIKSSPDASAAHPGSVKSYRCTPVALIIALAHPRNLFDINCRSQIISCRTRSRIYGWSHWLGARPLIKFLKSPWHTLTSVYSLPSHTQGRSTMQIHTGDAKLIMAVGKEDCLQDCMTLLLNGGMDDITIKKQTFCFVVHRQVCVCVWGG